MSFSDDQLSEMVQDFIESGFPESTPECSSFAQTFSLQHYAFLALEGLLLCDKDVELELRKRAEKYAGDMGSERRSIVRKRLVTRLRMDGYNASLCHSSWETTAECPGGDYEYVDVEVEGRRIILDVDFKSQFELARPTTTYARLSDALPSIFVGEETKLRTIIPLLCAAAQESMREKGLHVPPWRSTAYVKSKWLSACRKISSIQRLEMKASESYLSSAPVSWGSSIAYVEEDGSTF